MRATYIGTEDDHETEAANVFGLVFPKGEAVDVSSLKDQQQAKLRGNPTFTTAEAAKKSAKPATPTTSSGAQPDAEPDQFDAMSDDELRDFLKERDGKSPHPATGRPKLLAAARGDVAAKAEAEG